MEPSLQALICSVGACFIAWRVRCPYLGECRRGPRHIWNRRACLNDGSTPSFHIKKALYHTLALWDTKQIPTCLAIRVKLQPFFLLHSSVRVAWSDGLVYVSQGRLTPIPGKSSICVTGTRLTLHGPQGTIPPGSHLLRQSSVYCLAPESPVLRKCGRGPRYFWSRRACLAYSSATDYHVKKSLCHTLAWWNTKLIPTRLVNATCQFYSPAHQHNVCSPMAREIRVQYQVELYQRIEKWYLMPHCLTLSIIRYGSRVSRAIYGVVAIEKGASGSPSAMVDQHIYIYIYITLSFFSFFIFLYISYFSQKYFCDVPSLLGRGYTNTMKILEIDRYIYMVEFSIIAITYFLFFYNSHLFK